MWKTILQNWKALRKYTSGKITGPDRGRERSERGKLGREEKGQQKELEDGGREEEGRREGGKRGEEGRRDGVEKREGRRGERKRKG